MRVVTAFAVTVVCTLLLLGVFWAPVMALVSDLADESGVSVFTGDARGRAEPSAGGDARDLLIQLCGAFGGYVVLLIGFVVAGTVGLSVRHRRRDLALLRAIAATPGQVRRMLLVEGVLLCALGAAIGVPLGSTSI